MIQNFPYKQNQTLIDLQKLKSQINLILSNFERKDDLKTDVKTLNTSEFDSTDFNDMTNLKNFIISVLNNTLDLENDVKTLLTSTYDNDDYLDMTNLNTYLDDIYEKINNLKNDVKTLLTSTFLSTDYDDMTNLKNFVKDYVKSQFNSGYSTTEIKNMYNLMSVMGQYLLTSSLTGEIRFRLTNTYSLLDYSTMTNLTDYIRALFPPIFINLRTSESTGDNNFTSCNYTSYTTFFQYHYRLVFLFLCKSDGSEHFDHLYAFRSKSNTVTSGDIFTVFNFFPTSTLIPYVFAVGDVNLAINNTMILQLMIGNKYIKIDFNTISQYTGRTYCYHLKLLNCNLDSIAEKCYPAANNYFPNINAFKYSDMKQNTVLDDTTKAYHVYNYLTENDLLELTAYMVNDGSY